jgi:dihydroxy-acid dehydratase
VLLLTDGRFSGGTTGPVRRARGPEAVDGGPIAFVRDGDRVVLDVQARTSTWWWTRPSSTPDRRAGSHRHPTYTRGVLAKYAKLVGSAAEGAICG